MFISLGLDSSLKLDQELIDCDRVACLDADRLDDAIALTLQNVLHLHGFDDGQLLAVDNNVAWGY